MGSLASAITLLGDLRDGFGLSETQVGLIVGAGFLTVFVAQLTLARTADRGHAPLMVRIGLMAAAASVIGFAASSGLWTMRVWRGALGAAIGVAQPSLGSSPSQVKPRPTQAALGSGPGTVPRSARAKPRLYGRPSSSRAQPASRSAGVP